jgi:hypothetical protein
MKYFPASIRDAMRKSGAAATCVPVQLEGPDWETALFIHVSGPECKQDRRILKSAREPTPATLSAELMTHANAAIIVLRLEVMTVIDDPLVFEILLTPGAVSSHYECVKLLAGQQRICWFFGDGDFRVLQAQEQTIDRDKHESFESLAREAFAHDSLVRIAGKFDAEAALAEVAAHYAPRSEENDVRADEPRH